jgi:biopolymer transport protein ExbD
MERRYKEDMRRKPKDGQAAPDPSLLIIRAHKAAPFEKVYDILLACRTAGYSRAQLRAIQFGGRLTPAESK